ncbi:tetratricopeptide repeat protein [Algirhabdus cladophorae]|uniref:tetratricopeptide repeat protein n=1 Tax=Algirhabdus cladophorae TaxID=3377108 RepID=UPI003B84789A
MMPRLSFSSITLAAALALAPVTQAQAQASAGSYLAARHASFFADFDKAVIYYIRALAQDPQNPVLLENAISAYVGLGKFPQANTLASRMSEVGIQSQVASIVGSAVLVKDGAFDTLVLKHRDGGGIGPLVDGLLLAWGLVGQGNITDAFAQFDSLGEAPGLKNFAMYHKALALTSVGDLESADALFSGREAGPLRSTRRGALAHVEILSQLDRNDDAIDLIDNVFGESLDPGLQVTRMALAGGQTLPLTMARTVQDGASEVFYSVASALQGEASPSYALLYSRAAEFLREDHIEALLMSAEFLEELEQFDLANATYDRVPREDPAFHAAELGRAAALRQAGRDDAAIEVLRQLTETHGQLPAVHITLGDTLRYLERYDEASEAYDAAIALYVDEKPNQWFAYYVRGITHERIGEWPAAEADFRKALDLNADQPQVLNYLGYSMVEQDINLDEALEMIEKAVAARPNSGYIVDSLGWVLFRMGKYQEAVVHLERASELEAVDPIVNDHLGDAFWAVGRKIEAEFQWHRALSFDPTEDDAKRIRRKLEVGLDKVLEEEGTAPLQLAAD